MARGVNLAAITTANNGRCLTGSLLVGTTPIYLGPASTGVTADPMERGTLLLACPSTCTSGASQVLASAVCLATRYSVGVKTAIPTLAVCFRSADPCGTAMSSTARRPEAWLAPSGTGSVTFATGAGCVAGGRHGTGVACLAFVAHSVAALTVLCVARSLIRPPSPFQTRVAARCTSNYTSTFLDVAIRAGKAPVSSSA